MHALFLTPQLPYPPHAGGPMRNYGLIDALWSAGHTVDLITFVEPEQPELVGTPLHERCQTIITVPAPQRQSKDRLRDLLKGSADLVGRFHSPDYARALSKLLSGTQYDLIQIEGLEMASYLPLLRAGNPGARLVYDAHNAEYALQRLIHTVDRGNLSRLPASVYSFIQWRRLMRVERTICQQVDHVLTVSEADADALRLIVPDLKVDVIPNGIYAEDYAQTSHRLNLGPAALLFTGTMNYRPNVDAVLWFTERILDAVRAAVPETRLFVVGNKPHERLDAIRQRPDVEVTGYVQDVGPFLHSAAVYVAPLRMGSGTRLKLLQAMAAGCAIVSTPLGAGGLEVNSGQEIILAEGATAFAGSTVALLRNPEQRTALGEAAKKFVARRYDWSAIRPCLYRVYEEMGLG